MKSVQVYDGDGVDPTTRGSLPSLDTCSYFHIDHLLDIEIFFDPPYDIRFVFPDADLASLTAALFRNKPQLVQLRCDYAGKRRKSRTFRGIVEAAYESRQTDDSWSVLLRWRDWEEL